MRFSEWLLIEDDGSWKHKEDTNNGSLEVLNDIDPLRLDMGHNSKHVHTPSTDAPFEKWSKWLEKRRLQETGLHGGIQDIPGEKLNQNIRSRISSNNYAPADEDGNVETGYDKAVKGDEPDNLPDNGRAEKMFGFKDGDKKKIPKGKYIHKKGGVPIRVTQVYD